MKPRTRIALASILLLAAALLLTGCGSSTKETTGEAATGVAVVGFTECFNCHSDLQNPAGLRKPFGDVNGAGWLQSRHFNLNNSPDIIIAACQPCHNELGDGDLIAGFYDRTGNPVFGIGNVTRYIVGCESCHGGGGNHWGIGPLGNDFKVVGEFSVCTKCHELTTNTLHPDDERNIADTHLDNAATVDIEGYVLNPNARHSDLRGNTNSGTCIDCHEPHFADLEINRAWANSAHAGDIGINLILNETNAAPFVEDDFKVKTGGRTGTGFQACQRCHTSTGFRNRANNQDGYDPANNEFVAAGEQRELIYCWACHYNHIGGIREITTAGVPGVIFPSGAVASIDVPSNICAMCHQGRTSGGPITLSGTVANAIAKPGTDTFINIHYFAASASFLGNEVNGGYEYVIGNYVGRNTFGGAMPNNDTCVECHLRVATADPADHHFLPEVGDCDSCHSEIGANGFKDIRLPGGLPDYDGDGDAAEGLRFEVETLEQALIANIEDYAATVLTNAIIYNGTSYPYFFKDDGTTSYTFGAGGDTKLLPAAYNYQVSQKEPCGYIHNHRYIIQLLIDSIRDLSGAAGPYDRP